MCSSASQGAVTRLRSVLAELSAEDLKGMFGPQVLDRTAALLAAKNMLDAELARTVREGELTQAAEHDGLKSMASWLRGHARLSPAAVGQLVRNGRALEKLPAVAAALAGGAVTADAVSVIAAVAKPENLTLAEAQDVDLGGVDATLTEVATTRPHAELAQVVHHYLARLDEDGPEPDPTQGRVLSRPSTPTAASPAASSSTPSAVRSCRPHWKPSCRPAAAPATSAPGASSWPTRWCSWPTTPWPPAACRSGVRSSRT